MDIATDVLRGAGATAEITIASWLLAALFGLALAVARDLGPRPVKAGVVSVIVVLRAVPQVVLLYLLFFGLPSIGINIDGLLTAILVFGVVEGCFNAEYYRASFITVSHTQRDAGLSVGLTRFGVLRLVVIPQALRYMVAPLLNSFVSLMKLATLASAVGVPEILYRGLNDVEITGNLLLVIFIVVAIYATVTMPLSRLVGYLEKRSRRSYA